MIETCAYKTSKDLVCKKEEINKEIIKQYKNFELQIYYKRIHKRAQFKLARNSSPSIHNFNNWRFWIWKNKYITLNQLFKQLLYAKDPYEAKYQLIVNKRESIG